MKIGQKPSEIAMKSVIIAHPNISLEIKEDKVGQKICINNNIIMKDDHNIKGSFLNMDNC